MSSTIRNLKSKLSRLLKLFLPMSVKIGLCMASSQAISQVVLPPVNLGGSSFMDGVAGPGWLYQETLSHYRSTAFTDSNGDTIPGNNEANISVALSHLALITEKKVWGGFYGAEILLAVVNAEIGTVFGPKGNSLGFGDLIISPFLVQWTDSKLFGKPYWHRLNFNFILPTGSYDPNKSVNVGNNVFSFNPHYAFTLKLSPKFEVSARLHYLWNSKNNDPNPNVASNHTQPGQAFHMNLATSYEFAPGWRGGVAGYYLKQLTDHRIDGVDIAGSREQVFGIGPGISYANKGNIFHLNVYFESQAENRTEGSFLLFRYSKIF